MGEVMAILSLISVGAAIIMFLVILLISYRIGTTNHLLKKIIKIFEADKTKAGYDELIECAWCKSAIRESTSANHEGAVICQSCWSKQQRRGS
jgi:hypothetical protein